MTRALSNVMLYSCDLHDKARSSCMYRRVSMSATYSNRSHRKVLKILVAVLGTRTKEATRVSGRVRCNPDSTAA
eukprot:1125932-Prymnesium_polylepis.4